MQQLTHWIDGKPVQGPHDRSAPVFDPATGEETARVPLADPSVVDDAVEVATRAAGEWSKTTVIARQQVMFALREEMLAGRDELARIVTAEHGKTIDDAHGEIARGIEVVEHLCALPELLKGQFSEGVANAVDITSLRQPIGVCAGITPFNFPVMVPMWMAPVAIAAGNAFILKPSERDPSASLFLAEVFDRAGVPAGVFNVVNGDKDAVERLLDHPGIAAVSFVGSTPVAKAIYSRAAAAGKRVQALGGAKNHMVVLPDADMDAAADAAISAAYGSAGERCMAISVVVAVGDAGDALVPRIAQRADAIRVGAGVDVDTDMGPLITAAHRDRVLSYVDDGAQAGAELVVDGRERVPAGEGFFVGPCLFDHVTSDMRIYQEEIFGPVLSVVRVPSMQAALDLVDDNPYGNGVAIFTESGRSARGFASEVQAGMVGVNLPIPVPLSFYSFGGWNNSLFGDRHIFGPEGLEFYTRGKVITSRWKESVDDPPLSLGFPAGGG